MYKQENSQTNIAKLKCTTQWFFGDSGLTNFWQEHYSMEVHFMARTQSENKCTFWRTLWK